MPERVMRRTFIATKRTTKAKRVARAGGS